MAKPQWDHGIGLQRRGTRNERKEGTRGNEYYDWMLRASDNGTEENGNGKKHTTMNKKLKKTNFG